MAKNIGHKFYYNSNFTARGPSERKCRPYAEGPWRHTGRRLPKIESIGAKFYYGAAVRPVKLSSAFP
jgi:hypothetical protein